jgi:hypothetical protein
MNYNIEMIRRLAQQMAESVKVAVLEQQKGGEGTLLIAEIENSMREMLRQIGQQALGLFLSSMQDRPERQIDCPCGGTLSYQRLRPAQVTSVFGSVSYERAYYAGCTCQEGKAPLDELFGLQPGAVTAGLAALLSLSGIQFSYEGSRNWLEAFLLFAVSENTVRSETEGMGVLQAQQEAEWIQQSQDEVAQQARLRQPGLVPGRRYGSMDAAKVRIEPRSQAGQAPAEQEDWRDLKLLCWFETERVPPAQRSKRQRQKAAREQVPQRAKNIHYYAEITPAEQFGKLLWATGCQVQADLSQELIFLGDGAAWIWNLVNQYYPQAIQIVDWFHAEEYLEKVAAQVFPDLPKRADWLEGVSQALWDGQVEAVISACKALARISEEARRAVGYFYDNAERMRYDHFRAAGYMIGSGTVESGCKQIVSQRLKLPGAQWEVPGAVQTAKARAAWLSGQWQNLCDQRSALPLAV